MIYVDLVIDILSFRGGYSESIWVYDDTIDEAMSAAIDQMRELLANPNDSREYLPDLQNGEDRKFLMRIFRDDYVELAKTIEDDTPEAIRNAMLNRKERSYDLVDG